MPSHCCIKGCTVNSTTNPERKFYRFPNLVLKSSEGRARSEERRRLWLAAINLKSLNTKCTRICDKHFISGVKAKSYDHLNPDWVPSLNLGYTIKKSSELLKGRYERQLKRAAKKEVRDTATSSVEIEEQSLLPQSAMSSNEELMTEEFLEAEFLQDYEHELGEILACEPSHKSIETQTDLTMSEIDCLFSKLSQHEKALNKSDTNLKQSQLALSNKDDEIAKCRKEISKSKMSMDSFEDNDTKTRYFTGLSHYLTLITIYKAIEKNIPHCLMKGLTKFQILILTLMKLRLDLPFNLLGYMFGISTQTASRKFHKCVLILSWELSAFVTWPEKHVRAHYTPECFKRVFGTRLAVIIDCYEIRIEKSGQPVARAATYSQYKSTETVKYLIGIAPSGAIIYTSKGYGGRSSDKYVAENSDFLSFVEPGDIVLSDRGFLIEEAVRARGAELDMPSFLQGRLQLDSFSVDDSEMFWMPSKLLQSMKICKFLIIEQKKCKYNSQQCNTIWVCSIEKY